MDYREITKKVKDFKCYICKLDYQMDIEKVQNYPNRPLNYSIAHRTGFDIIIADYVVRINPIFKIEDMPLNRYKMILDIIIDVLFKEPLKKTLEKKLIEEKDKDLIFEFLKLSTSQINETTKKCFEWMGFKRDEITPTTLIKVFKDLSQLISNVEVEH